MVWGKLGQSGADLFGTKSVVSPRKESAVLLICTKKYQIIHHKMP